MARKCYVTGIGTKSGNNRPHSLKATRRKWKANLQKVRIKDADAWQYIGEEIMVNNPSQIFIVNSTKNKSQLKQIREEATKSKWLKPKK